MNIEFGQIQEMKDKAYRHGAVNAQLEIDLPLQIRALRKQRNWTQPQLAAIAEMRQPRISNMEKPGATHFSLETLRRLAEAFDVALIVRFGSFGELLDWSDQFSPDDFQVPSFEQELPEMEARCRRSSSAAKNPGAGAELQAQQFCAANFVSMNQHHALPDRIPPGAAEMAAMAMARPA